MTESTSNFTKHFESQKRESALYSFWESLGIFNPQSCADTSADVFNIAMPPPNANGELHLGHCFGYTVMDILGRFYRLSGKKVLLLPGKDHAGIQTQVVYEKKLKAEGIDYKALNSNQLYEQCYNFCIDRSAYMRNQEKLLGLSADWSKEMFTLDPKLNHIIFDTFKMLWDDGLVYKGHRIVNWSVFSQTGISDVEVEYVERQGSLWYLQYPLCMSANKEGFDFELPSGNKLRIGEKHIVVATTRPETMLGDTAIAVHPDDQRYQHLIGKEVNVPLVNRKIKIIADKRIDPEFGTGAVKVTPAHDFNDYDIGQDHNLDFVSIIGKDGKMTLEAGGEYSGLTIEQCRIKVLEDLQSQSLLLETKKITHKVPVGERGKDIIEPLISEQWFLSVDKPGKSLKQNALNKLKNGEINIYPSRFQVLFEQWLENLRDWNISRQLWWGHKFPVWYSQDIGGETYVGATPPEKGNWIQETDTFDTWFSSGQWPFSTAAANGLLDLKDNKSAFFPTHTMVMGRDILFFWACRMLLLSVYRTGNIPWKNIFFTGLIRDEHGQKMSKSKSNGIEPKDIINKYGTDALRIALVMGATPGNDLSLSEKKFEGYSKFINKLWNAAKLIEMKIGKSENISPLQDLKLQSNIWIIAELQKVFDNVTQKLNSYEISIAIDELYNFTWTKFCDWYLEIMKVMIDKGDKAAQLETTKTTLAVFKAILIMLHPFIPFITEEIYQNLPVLKSTKSLAAEKWDTGFNLTAKESPSFERLNEIVTAIRSVKAALAIPHQLIRIALDFVPNFEERLLITELAKTEIVDSSQIEAGKALRKPISKGVIICETDNKEQYIQRLKKDREQNKSIISSLESKLTGDFIKFAKPDVVQREQEKFESAKRAVEELERELAGI